MRNQYEPHKQPVIPGDFPLCNFTDMEEEARWLSQSDDNWVDEPGQQPMNFHPYDVRDPNHPIIDNWRGSNRIEMHRSIAPYVKNDVLSDCNLSDPPAINSSIRKAVQLALMDLIIMFSGRMGRWRGQNRFFPRNLLVGPVVVE